MEHLIRLFGKRKADFETDNRFKLQSCPLLALSGHDVLHCTCLLSGVKRTCGAIAGATPELAGLYGTTLQYEEKICFAVSLASLTFRLVPAPDLIWAQDAKKENANEQCFSGSA